MKLASRIYCIEGHWDFGDREVEPSVEPILEMLKSMGQWEEYARRDCATVEEMCYFLEREWNGRCREGSILYIASHGAPGQIRLSNDHVLGLETLSAKANCTNCLVHFGGCEVLSADQAQVQAFMNNSGATGVSGYRGDVAWSDTMWPPALALELMLFSSIEAEAIDLGDGRSARKLRRLAEDLQQRFPECKFELYTKWDER